MIFHELQKRFLRPQTIYTITKKIERDAATSRSSGKAYLVFLVCAKALPATLLDVLLKRPSESILDALLATVLLVCLVLVLPICFSPFLNIRISSS